MKKMLKISLFIIGFCITLILLSNSKVQAANETVTTVQELQEIMGAAECSVIEGTTLKITKNFTWKLINDVYIKNPELTIDFNGNEIRVENSIIYNKIVLKEGTIILKDSKGESGGFFWTNHFLDLEYNTKLIIENGQYKLANEDEKNGVILNNNVIQNNGGTITVKDGEFKCIMECQIFQVCSGKMIINNGDFQGKGSIITVTRNSNQEQISSEIIINNGKFYSEKASVLTLYSGPNKLDIKLNGGILESSGTYAITMGQWYHTFSDRASDATLKLDGCVISGDWCALWLSSLDNKWNVDAVNCTLKSKNSVTRNGAISIYYNKEFCSAIKERVKNYDGDIFQTSTKKGMDWYTYENTYKELVFKDGKLVSAKGKPNITDSNNENNDKIITKIDSKTNIKLEAPSNIIPDNTIIDVIEITSGETFDKIKNVFPKIESFKAFDITLKVNNTNIQPNGKVKISIPIPAVFDASRLIVYRFDEDNTKTEYQVTVANGYATFETDHFSTYVLGEQEKTANETQEGTNQNEETKTTGENNTKLPQTGEETNTFARWLTMLIILGIIWLCSMIFIDKEKKKMLNK